jgi:glycosyltransferase involved in cell wall biosynthesis
MSLFLEMKKLLIINYEYPPIGGGAASATAEYATRLAKSQNVTVLTSHFKGLPLIEEKAGLKIIRIKSLRTKKGQSNFLEMLSFICSAMLVLPKLLKAEKPEHALIFFASPFGLLGLFAKQISGINYSVFIRGGDIPEFVPEMQLSHRLLKPLTKTILKNASNIFSNGICLQELTEKLLRESQDSILCSKKVINIPNGIKPCLKPRSSLHKPLRLLYAGRIVQNQKNIMILADILSKLQDLDTTLTIVGEGPDLKRFQDKAKKLGLNNINYTGWLDRDSLEQQYIDSDILIFPSFFEGVSNVLLEGISTGIWVIASAIPDNIYFLKDYKQGRIAQNQSASSYAQIIREIVNLKAQKPEPANQELSWDKRSRELNQELIA